MRPARTLDFGSSVNNVRVDGVTVSGSDLSGCHNVTISNVTNTGPTQLDIPNGQTLNLVFDHDSWNGVGHPDNEGRLSIRSMAYVTGGPATAPIGVTVRNSHFGNGGCSDGIQLVGNEIGAEIGPNNEFEGIAQGSCVEHADPIQIYGGGHNHIFGNYFHNNNTALMFPDGTDHDVIENNVFISNNGYPALILGNDDGTIARHNVVIGSDLDVYDGNPSNTGTCTQRKSRNEVIQDNVSPVSGCGTNTTIDHNLTSSQVTFVGGSGRCAYELAPGSVGIGGAHDGTNVGVTDCP